MEVPGQRVLHYILPYNEGDEDRELAGGKPEGAEPLVEEYKLCPADDRDHGPERQAGRAGFCNIWHLISCAENRDKGCHGNNLKEGCLKSRSLPKRSDVFP